MMDYHTIELLLMGFVCLSGGILAGAKLGERFGQWKIAQLEGERKDMVDMHNRAYVHLHNIIVSPLDLDGLAERVAKNYVQIEAENVQMREALAEHSLYYLDPAGNELFDQPLNWEAELLKAIGDK